MGGSVDGFACSRVLWMQRDGQERIKALESELGELSKQGKSKSLVDRRVSQQLEKIAYGQEEFAEERSREAIRQSEIAQEMTLRSRQNAREPFRHKLRLGSVGRGSAVGLTNWPSTSAWRQNRPAGDRLVELYLSGRSLGSQSYAVYRGGDMISARCWPMPRIIIPTIMGAIITVLRFIRR